MYTPIYVYIRHKYIINIHKYSEYNINMSVCLNIPLNEGRKCREAGIKLGHSNSTNCQADPEVHICERWLIHLCSIILSYTWSNSLAIQVPQTARQISRCTWLIHVSARTHLHLSHESFKYVPWLIKKTDMTHSYVNLDSYIRIVRSILTWACGSTQILNDTNID